MITVNNKKYEWKEGLTVNKLMKKLESSDRFKLNVNKVSTVVINKELVPPEKYDERQISDKDEIFLLSVIMGG